MEGYRVGISSLPRILWACETTVDHYMWHNTHKVDMLELSYSRFSEKTQIRMGKTRLLHRSALCAVPGLEPRQSFCPPEADITILSVAVRCPGLTAEPVTFTPADVQDEEALLLPAALEELTLQEETDALALFHRVISAFGQRDGGSRARALSEYFALLAFCDGLVRSRLGERSLPGADLYLKKADAILSARCGEKWTLSALAAQLHVSPGYLSALFRQKTGLTFTQHLLAHRMRRAEELFADPNIPTARVAALLGFCDENHFRKQFKRFFGMNVRSYRATKNGMTLYHKEPTGP